MRPLCVCGEGVDEKVYRLGSGVFVSTGSSVPYLRKMRKKENGGTLKSNNFKHWKISPKYNIQVQVYDQKVRTWYLGVPRMVYPCLVRLRSFLNAITDDAIVSGTMWILFEVDCPEFMLNDFLYIIVVLLLSRIRMIAQNTDTYDGVEFLSSRIPSQPVERYIQEAEQYLSLTPGSQISHLVLRSVMYGPGLESRRIMDPSRPLPQLKAIVTVCNSRVGQMDQSYFSILSPNGGLIQMNQSVNSTDELIFSFFVGSSPAELVARFQTVAIALTDCPLRLSAAQLGDVGLYVSAPDSFFMEVFAESLQCSTADTLPHNNNAAPPQMTESAMRAVSASIQHQNNIARRLRPGAALSLEEKFYIVMSALPSYPYRMMAKQCGESEEDFILRTQCQICLEDYVENELVRALPCMHVFHGACAESWFQVRLQCPNCCVDVVEILANPATVE